MKYSYNIIGLDCANCAREIEESLNKNKKFKNVIVNFSTSKISFYSDKEISLEELNHYIKQIEPSVFTYTGNFKEYMYIFILWFTSL